MTFYCLTEPGYGTSNWHKHITAGLMEEIKAKRYDVVFPKDIPSLSSRVSEEDVLLLIGSDCAWIEHAIALASPFFDSRIVVLGNVELGTSNKAFSIVSSNISHDVSALCAYLNQCGKTRLAMYGINPLSASDRFRKNAFLAAGGTEKDVFENSKGLADCFCSFFPHLSRYDGIICANDFCAISFVRHLRARGLPLPFLVSCGETALAKHFTPSITNLKTNYMDFGRSGIRLARLLLKNNAIGRGQIFLKSEIVPNESTACLPVRVTEAHKVSRDLPCDHFYADAEVDEMLRMEKILCACDETDKAILSLLLAKKSYAEIADTLYLSINGIKYKLKQLLASGGLSSKDALLCLLEKYGLEAALQKNNP